VKTGVQDRNKYLKTLDSGFRRNDVLGISATFYESIITDCLVYCWFIPQSKIQNFVPPGRLFLFLFNPAAQLFHVLPGKLNGWIYLQGHLKKINGLGIKTQFP